VSDRIQKGQTLPADFAAQLRRLREQKDPRYGATLIVARMNGWTCQALAAALGVSRQAVEQASARAEVNAPGRIPDVPLPPRKPQPEAKPPRRRLLVNEELAERLRDMQRIAATVNGAMPSDAPERAVSEEFTALLFSLTEQGVSVKHLAEAIGVWPNTVSSRLARHGYKEPSPSLVGNRYLGRPAALEKTHCLRGHELAGNNLYVVPKTGARVCRACNRARTNESRARRRKAAAATGGEVG
jgi:hypothetical protein